MKRHKIASSALALALLLALTVPQPALAFEKLFYYFDNVYGYDNFKKNSKEVDIIAPQMYTVGHDLKIKKPSSKSLKLVRESKKKKVDTVPLLVNADFSKSLMSDILINDEVQEDIIEFMIEEADDRGYTGWQFDFENLNHLDRDLYSAFVAKAYKALKKEGLQFSVAVITRSTDYDPTSTNQDWSSGYDYKAIAANSDFVSLMSYDDPYSVGPVASMPFTERVLEYMMTQIPNEKISLGIPLYCWKWDDQINMRVGSLTQGLALKEYNKGEKKSREKGYDEDLGAYYYKYKLKNQNYTVWCENDDSIEAKIDLIDKYDLHGFSAWAIGQEATWFWREMKKY
jgi:spore germination protein YaaH